MNELNSHLLFSLFHHNTAYKDGLFDFNSKEFLKSSPDPSIEVPHIADYLYQSVIKSIEGLSDKEISLTLTGGMDSRLILACLLKAGVKPNCLTFGNPQNHDVVFAKGIAKQLGLPFHNTCQQPPNKEWYYKWVVETIKRDNGNAHLHRAHRTAAIAEHAETYHPKVLFTGHMGGEGLRGLTYNNYFASSFFEMVNEGKAKPEEAARKVLYDYFLKTDNINFENLLAEVKKLSWMQHDKETNKLFFLYDLVAKIHHAQDIRLYQTYIPNVVPVYLQKGYLDLLFFSRFNFLDRKDSFMHRLYNPEFYCKVIQELYPPLLDFPFANGFTPREYLRGLWYYVPVKTIRDQKRKKKYPPTFTYGQWYIDFVKEHAQNIDLVIWEIYDKKHYWKALDNSEHQTNEGYWHKFSNPIYFDLVDKYKKGLL